MNAWGIADVDRVEQVPLGVLVERIGEISEQHANEKDFVEYLLENKHILEQVIGLVPNDKVTPQVNSGLYGSNLRPDIVFRTKDTTYIVAKSTRAKWKSQAMREQISAIGQLLLYRIICGNRAVKLHLIDTCIHKETLAVVKENDLPIILIQANRDAWCVCYKTKG